mgnify:CR=1 FL=1
MITQSILKDCVSYNEITGVFTSVKSRPPIKFGDVLGSIKPSGRNHYSMIMIAGKRYGAHNLALLYVNGIYPKGYVDHIDGNGLNNKISNLRLVTSAINAKNQRLRSNNKSGFMGVTWREDTKQWRARINDGNKRINLGSFDLLSDAVKCRIDSESLYGYHANHGAR